MARWPWAGESRVRTRATVPKPPTTVSGFVPFGISTGASPEPRGATPRLPPKSLSIFMRVPKHIHRCRRKLDWIIAKSMIRLTRVS